VTERRVLDDAALAELPIFPLPQVVLFPRVLMPLHIFEPRYRAMLDDAMRGHRAIAMALIPDPGDLDEHGRPKIATVAGVGIVIEQQALPDGRSNIVLHGQARVQLEELPFIPPYRRARATVLHDRDVPVGADDRAALLAAANAFTSDVARREPRFGFSVPPSLSAGAVADLCAHHLVVDAGVRQALLAELDPAARVRRVTAELAAQHAMLLRERGGVTN
jgi:ATP-dependent Lon protease